MFIKLKSGTMLNLFYLQDAFQGKHNKCVVIFYLVNGVKLIEEYESEQDALDRVDEVHTIMLSAGLGGGSGTTPSGSNTLEKTIISNVVIGATNPGTTFSKGTSFTQFVEMISKKEVAPTISASFTGTGIKEAGTIVNGTKMTLNITNMTLLTIKPTTINFYVAGTKVNTQSFVDGQSSYTFDYTTAIKTNTNVVAELIYGNNQKLTKNDSFTFVYASYNGITTLDNITDSDANTLIATFAKNVKNTKSYTWNNIDLDDERFCYIYPKSFGALTNIKDGNGFNQMDSYTRFEVNITYPTDGQIVPYYVYLLTDTAGGDGFTQIYN